MADLVGISLKLLCRVHRENDNWVAGCPRLDVYSQGETREEAKQVLKEAVALFVESCLERDTLAEVLRDCGFRLVPAGVHVPEHVADTSVSKRPTEDDELLGEPFSLDLTIPAYQAALVMENSKNVNAR